MNPLGAFILVVLIAVVLGASRRFALLAMMAGVMYLTQFQQIAVLGLHLYAIRFLELAGFVRVMRRREFSFVQLNEIDRALLWLYGVTTVVFVLRFTDGQADQIGKAVDAFLCYFTFRGLIGGIDDFRWFLRAFVLLLAPYVLLVVVESRTGHNPLAVLGGVEGGSNWTRNGRPRCFGSFRQPDLLGMFAASFIPLYVGMACMPRERKRALLGMCFCLIIVLASNSGGPAAAAAMGLLGWGFWLVRTEMRKVRWGIVAMIIALALVMKDPVWFIFEHISNVTGGDGWHRGFLIDVALRHLGQWWLAGMDYMDTKNWFPYTLDATGAADITNQFISFGLAAGLGGMALFILLLTRAFSNLGKALATVRFNSQGASSDNEFLLWGLGVMLVVHIIDWFGITYFDQMYVVWFMQLAFVSTLSQAFLAQPAAVVLEEEVIEPEIEAEVEAAQPTVGLSQPN